MNQQLAEARKMMDFSLSIFPQLLANLALTDKDFSNKIAHLKQTVEQRGKAVFDVLDEMKEWDVSMPKGAFIYGQNGNMEPFGQKIGQSFYKKAY